MDAKPRSVVCHANSPGILPVQWCLKNGVSLERPGGYEGQDFDWADYLKQSGTEAAPDACFPDVRAAWWTDGRGFESGVLTRMCSVSSLGIRRSVTLLHNKTEAKLN